MFSSATITYYTTRYLNGSVRCAQHGPVNTRDKFRYMVSSLLSALTSLTSVWTNRTRHDRYDSLLIPRRASSFVCRTSGDASKSAIGTVLPSCALRRYL